MSLRWAIFFSEDGKGNCKEIKTVLQKIERNRLLHITYYKQALRLLHAS
jgi:hypothetical protein